MKADLRLAGKFLATYPREAVHFLEEAGAVASADVLSRCSAEVVAATLRHMDPTEAAAVLVRLPAEATSGVLSDLPLGSAASILRSLDRTERDRLLAGASEESARSLRAALDYPEGTAGSLMDSNIPALPSEISVSEARKRLRRRSKPTGNYLYLVDQGRKPVGVVSLSELMLALPKTPLASLMRSSVARVPASAGPDLILAHPGWRELHALPVVDSEGTLVGILRRETYERLRDELTDRGTSEQGGFGLALAEVFWTLSASMVDELGQTIRPDASQPSAGGQDDD